MLGIPTETKEEMMDTINMIKTIKPEIHGCSVYTPAPGSELFDYCIKNNLFDIKTHYDYRRDVYTKSKIKGIDYKFIQKISKQVIDHDLSLSQILAKKVVDYSIRKNRFILNVIKLLCRIKFLNNLAHKIVHKING